MDYESFLTRFPIELNAQQREAVQAVNGPVLLLAVPGSGKTTVLVARLGYMICCCGIDPSNILILTYTVAATNDMKERFSRFFGAELGSTVEFRTINSVCAGVIKEYGRRIGRAPFELENDEKVLLAVISSLYQQHEEEYPTESDLKDIRTRITYIKNLMLSEDEIRALEKDAGCHLFDIYKGYCRELRNRSRMDYDDQMVYAYKLLKGSPELLAYFQGKYPYICVDEAQDTSKIQHEIIALLASKTGNLFMVGDEDQSIYGFRAAYPEALLSFEENHPGAKVLLMEENFRSNADIVTAADRFIQKNTLRHEKHMKATKPSGASVKEISLRSRGGQYSYLLKVAKECREQTAVLYRDNESAVPLVDLLERNGVPYRIRSADLTFFTNRVVQDIQNIMRFAYDMNNADLFMQIYYKVSSYLTKQQAVKACEISRAYNIPVFTAVFRHVDLKPNTLKSLRALETHFTHMKDDDPKAAVSRIIQFMGYGGYMERTGLGNAKIYILKTIAGRESTVSSFLDRMRDLRDIIQNKENDYNCPLILSTIHGSKGLEYDNVYLIDVQDGLFPDRVPQDLKHADLNEISHYEEERRLFYVGATRAKNNLFLFSTREQSTFTKELFPGKQENVNADRKSEGKTSGKTTRLTAHSGTKKTFDRKAFDEFEGSLTGGDVVKHKTFGEGVIISTDGKTASIRFGQETKKLDLKILYQNGLLSYEI